MPKKKKSSSSSAVRRSTKETVTRHTMAGTRRQIRITGRRPGTVRSTNAASGASSARVSSVTRLA